MLMPGPQEKYFSRHLGCILQHLMKSGQSEIWKIKLIPYVLAEFNNQFHLADEDSNYKSWE